MVQSKIKKGETDAFISAAERRVQPLAMGINRTFFAYNTLAGDTAQSADGTVGAAQQITQVSAPAQVGEYLSARQTRN